jgi:hypothetical protein
MARREVLVQLDDALVARPARSTDGSNAASSVATTSSRCHSNLDEGPVGRLDEATRAALDIALRFALDIVY